MTPEKPTDQYVRMIMAVALCLIAIWAYNVFFFRPPARRPAVPGPAVGVAVVDEEEPAPPGRTAETEGPVQVPEEAEKIRAEEVPPEMFVVSAGPFEMEWTNEGASLVSLRLTEFYKTTEKEELLRLIPPIEEGKGSLALLGLADLDRRCWKILERGEDGRITFQTAATHGLIVRKTITLPQGDDHHLLIDLTFESPGAKAAALEYSLRGACGIVEEAVGYGSHPQAVIVPTGENGVRTVAIKKVKEGPLRDEREVLCVGVENKYFACLLVPIGLGDRDLYSRTEVLLDSELLRPYRERPGLLSAEQMKKVEDRARNNLAASIGIERIPLEPGEIATHRFLFFAGPKQEDLFLSYAEAPEGVEGYTDPHFERILFRGMTGGISHFFVGVLSFIHKIVPNWGIAIIILTFIVRAALHPLNRKAQKSMHGMSKLKPQMDAIKEKYKGRKSKDASAKMQKEILGLYKEHGVNPAGGCLPMVFQLPIFIGLYWGINQAVDLRHAPFVLWIDDLSAQDALFDLGFKLPFLNTSSFNLLPLLVIASWILQQKMQPKPADPQMQQQQKIMTYMLFFMGFIFYTVPSGLNLYFFTSAFLGMFENRWIKKRLEAATPPPPTPEKRYRKKPTRKGKKLRRV